MDRAKGILVKTEIGDKLWAVKKTTLYWDAALKQKAFTINKDDKIGDVLEVTKKYIQIYYVEDEDNQKPLYISPKTKTYILISSETTYNYNTNNTNQELTQNNTEENSTTKTQKSNQWLGNVLSVISESLAEGAAIFRNSSNSYEDYVYSDSDAYINYTYSPETPTTNTKTTIKSKSEPSNNNNVAIYIVCFVILLLILVVVLKKSNISSRDNQEVKNYPPQLIYI